MTAHTPGPWRAVEIPRYGQFNIWGPSKEPDRGTGTPIATTTAIDRSGQYDREQNEANAELIAAAPSMADAGNTLAAYVYSILNPGSIPQHVRAAMTVFEAVS